MKNKKKIYSTILIICFGICFCVFNRSYSVLANQTGGCTVGYSAIVDYFKVSFNADKHGSLIGTKSFNMRKGENLGGITIPTPVPETHYYFSSWKDGSGKVVKDWKTQIVHNNMSFIATFAKLPSYTVHFTTDGHGKLEGITSCTVDKGKRIATLPKVKANKGYSFNSWYQGTKKVSPMKISIIGNTTFKAVFTKNITTVQKIAMYRLYNPNSGEHFYTANASERDKVRKAGWRYEGIGWYAPSKGSAVYRLYNPNAGDHHYTTNVSEKNHLVKVGWRYEGISWHSGGKVKVYRQYNPNARAGAHNFTINVAEKNNLVKHGWRDEGVAWYAE